MGKAKEPPLSKLFMSLMTSTEAVGCQGIMDLESLFGKVDFVSERFPFDWTDYYTPEMGSPLFKQFIAFEKLIPMSALPDIKHMTNRLEEKYNTTRGSRQVNIDPGYLCLQHVILATTKAYTHRPYLRGGIYADLTLIYRDRSYRSLEWTYPDYGQPGTVALFNQLRKRYREELKGGHTQIC